MLIAVLFATLLAIGVPIIFVLGVTGMVYVYQMDLPSFGPQRLFVGLNSS